MSAIELQALEFLTDAGITLALQNLPNDRFANNASAMAPPIHTNLPKTTPISQKTPATLKEKSQAESLVAHADVINQAKSIAAECETLEQLKTAIQDFDGLSVKKNATQIVFADGQNNADIMIIGDVPATQEDLQGIPFSGESGKLLDKILACINLSRDKNVYMTNILNWRPPGNRTPTKEEMEISAPFVLRHIQLINPNFLILCGGGAAQTLLQSKESISRLRGEIHTIADRKAIATYHPSSLVHTPLQKKKVWQDMLLIQGLINA